MKRLIGVGLVFLLLPAAAWGKPFEVENEDEAGPGSLGHTIVEAGFRDTIVVGPGTYPLTHGDTLLDQENVIRGAGAGRTTIVPTGGGEALTPGENVVDATVAPPRQPDEGGGSSIETKAQIIALVAILALFLFVLDLVRRRRLAERYALLWMLAAIALLVLAIWTDGLDVIADAMGIEEPANAIFILAFGVVFGLLLNFSVATSRLSEETKILAQEAARLDNELRAARGELPTGNGASAPGRAEQAQGERPVAPQPGAD